MPQTVPETFGGTLVVVNAIDDEADDFEEMCFIFETGKIHIFQSTEQLSIFLEFARASQYQLVFATSLSSIVFLLSIILLFISGASKSGR